MEPASQYNQLVKAKKEEILFMLLSRLKEGRKNSAPGIRSGVVNPQFLTNSRDETLLMQLGVRDFNHVLAPQF